MKTSRFQYTRRDPSNIKERAKQQGGDFDSIFKPGTKLFKPRDGKNIIRILPPAWPDAEHYGYDIWLNYNIGIDNQSYLSLSKMKKERDPIVEARKQAERDGDKKLADSLEPKRRVLMYVVDRSNEQDGPQLWSAPWTVDKSFAALAFDEDTNELVMVDDPETGNDIKFVKEGQGQTTKYPAEQMRIFKPSRLSEDDRNMNEWLEFIVSNPIPNLLNFYTYDHISEVFSGHVAKSEDESPLADARDVAHTATSRDTTGSLHHARGVDGDADEETTPTTIDSIRARLAQRGKPSEELPFNEDEQPSISQRARAARR